MKALTLKQPWAWAVAHAGKDVENRTWKPPASIIGQRIAIHAGKTYDIKEIKTVDAYMPDPQAHIRGAIVAVATVVGWIKENGDWQTPGISGISRETGKPFVVDRGFDSSWFTGPYGWLLTDVVALPKPLACKGMQGLWEVPADIEAEINKQLEVKP